MVEVETALKAAAERARARAVAAAMALAKAAVAGALGELSGLVDGNDAIIAAAK